jgi:hypothetical protein
MILAAASEIWPQSQKAGPRRYRVKNFLRRLFRFVNDPRYGIFYSPTPEAYKKAWESVVGDSLKQPFSMRTDPMPGDRPSFKTAFRELSNFGIPTKGSVRSMLEAHSTTDRRLIVDRRLFSKPVFS